MLHSIWLAISSFVTGIKAADLIALTGVLIAVRGLTISARSAEAAATAGRAAVAAIDSQRALHEEERRTSYYQLSVVDPSIDAITAFRQSVKRLLTQCVDEMKSLGDGAPITAHRGVTQRATTTFNTHYEELQFSVLVAARSWQEEELIREVTVSLTRLQDDMTAAISRQLSGRKEDSDCLRILQERVSELLSVVVRYDRDAEALSIRAAAEHSRVTTGDPQRSPPG